MFSIGYVASQVGVSGHTLRKWEQRYGFPRPSRSGGGTRRYSETDLALLSEAKRKIDQGHRPAEVFSDLASLMVAGTARNVILPEKNVRLNELLSLVTQQEYDHLHDKLEKLAIENGVNGFIEDIAAPLMRLVGSKWANKELYVFEEHSVSAAMQSVLDNLIRQSQFGNAYPVVLLCTVPGEWHSLSLHMVTAAFANAGAKCFNFSGSLPTAEIVAAAQHYHADIIALSVSSYAANRLTLTYLHELRQSLDDRIRVWVGGSGAGSMPLTKQDVQVFTDIRRPAELIREMRLAGDAGQPGISQESCYDRV